ncbi:MAG: hypothetical protein KDK78_11815, partial [Chlamydiia bacterium]|nr:hypothetical protein [Chlamydiia bacterium]
MGLSAVVSTGTLERRIRSATDLVERVLSDPEHGVPRELLRRAHAIIILREYKGGIIFGASLGK